MGAAPTKSKVIRQYSMDWTHASADGAAIRGYRNFTVACYVYKQGFCCNLLVSIRLDE
jgi:hypothetical protein